jgi:hypothetical protein
MIKVDNKAMKKWNEISDGTKKELLSNVYCSKCQEVVTVTAYELESSDMDLIIKGKCSLCSYNVARLIEGDLDEDVFEQIDEQKNGQIKENNKLLMSFKGYLLGHDLADKTIKKHISNVEFYINTFLLYYEIEKPHDNLNSIDAFFSFFLPHKTMFGSLNNTKLSIASLKKFYNFLLLIDDITKGEYNQFLQIIKENKQKWYDSCNDEYVDEDY